MTDNIIEFPGAARRYNGLSDAEVQKTFAFAHRLMTLGLATKATCEVDCGGHKSVVIEGKRKIEICKVIRVYAAIIGGDGGVIAGSDLEEVLNRTNKEIAPLRPDRRPG